MLTLFTRTLSFIDSCIIQPLIVTMTIIFVPWPSMIKPMKSLLNADDTEKDGLTARWLDAKLDELRFVGITVGCLWPYFCRMCDGLTNTSTGRLSRRHSYLCLYLDSITPQRVGCAGVVVQ